MKGIIAGIFFGIICTTRVFSNVDSLENRLQSAEGTDRLAIISKIAKSLNRKDRASANKYFLMFEVEYKLLDSPPEFEGNYYSHKGIYLHNTGNNEEAIRYFLSAQEIFEAGNNYEEMWEVYHNLGAVYEDVGDYGKSLEVYLKALKVAEGHLSEGAVAGSSNNLGIIYADQGNFTEAIRYFHLSRSVYSKNPLSWGYGNSLNNLGQCYNLLQKFDSSEYYFKKALDVWEGAADQKGQAMTSHNLGALYGSMKKLDLAELYLSKSLAICREMNEQFGISLNLGTLSDLYFDQNKEQKGFEYLENAVEHTRRNGLLPLLQNNLRKLSGRYKSKLMFREALVSHEEFFQIYDSMNNAEKTKNLLELTEKFESEKKEAEIARQNEELAVKDLKISKDQNRMLLLGGGLLLLVGFSVFTFINLRQKKKANREITLQKNEIEKQKDELEEKNREITDSIIYAKNLQDAILPPRRLVKKYLEESFILYKPKDIIAGDFYFMEVRNNHIVFAAADCTGHGVPGAMVSVVCANAMNRAVKEFGLLEAGKILDKVSVLVQETFEKSEHQVRDGMDISLCSLDLSSNIISWAGANNPLWLFRKGELIEFRPDKQPVGNSYYPHPFTSHIIPLEKEDAIYIFSDGYADQFGGLDLEKNMPGGGKKFKASNFKKLLSSIQELPMHEQIKRIDDVFEKWKGALEQIDDVCVIGVKF